MDGTNNIMDTPTSRFDFLRSQPRKRWTPLEETGGPNDIFEEPSQEEDSLMLTRT